MTPAVLLDALGTLVELQPPAPRLRARLAEEGFVVSEERAAAGFAAEISYYLGHHLEGSDRERLDDLRDRCATAMMEALEVPGLDHSTARRAMLGALEFTAYPDALEGLRGLRERGHRLVVASNWDCSLPDWLRPTGLLDLVDGVVTSADAGAAKPDPAVFRKALELAGVDGVVTSADARAAKPDPAVFRKALELAGVDGAGAVHVGDSLDNDVAGARALGIRAILVRRVGEAPTGVESVRALTEVATLL